MPPTLSSTVRPIPDNFCFSCAQRLGFAPSPLNLPCTICGQHCAANWQLEWAEQMKASQERMRTLQQRFPYMPYSQSTSVPNNVVIPSISKPPVIPPPTDGTIQRPAKRKRTESSSEPAYLPMRDFAQPRSIRRIVLPPGATDAPAVVLYQSLELLIVDMNKLLNTPHEEQAFHFKGACAVVADPAVGNSARVAEVAWEIIRKTALAFNLNTLKIQSNPRSALFMTPSSAIWMGLPPDMLDKAAPPCRRCEHLLTVGVEPCVSGSLSSRAASNYNTFPTTASPQIMGQRIVVALKHFPT
ncbi:hypothetical protein C8R43DRAFT_496625 [Mycena crocata]|nr:hypothetical protein C8R43DRAFT_496625 [Mycena crocata]